jgi:hypothetical protein
MVTNGRLLATAAAALLVLSCGNQRNETRPANALDSRVCTQDDLGGGYNEETAGNFLPSNLGDLGNDSGAQTRNLVASGLVRGHFAYWKKTPGEPPFEPQTDVVCQVLEFRTGAEAAAFVRSLKPSPESLVPAGIAWLPDGQREVDEQSAPAEPAGARAFLLRAQGGGESVAVQAVIAATGPYVRTVYIETPGAAGQIEHAAAILIATISRNP